MPTTLITGANQGLGLEFARQYAAAGWHVIACCRNPIEAKALYDISQSSSNVEIRTLDVRDADAIGRLAHSLRNTAIDLLLNNAGLIGPFPLREHLPRQHFGRLDYGLWTEVIETNTFGPVRLAEALLDQVASSAQKKIVTLSSTVGSIAEGNRPAMAYATSKAAVNKAMTLIAGQVRDRGVIVALLCPGYVRTRMNVDGRAPVEARDSVAGMRRIINGLTLAQSGSFTRYNGESIAW